MLTEDHIEQIDPYGLLTRCTGHCVRINVASMVVASKQARATSIMTGRPCDSWPLLESVNI